MISKAIISERNVPFSGDANPPIRIFYENPRVMILSPFECHSLTQLDSWATTQQKSKLPFGVSILLFKYYRRDIWNGVHFVIWKQNPHAQKESATHLICFFWLRKEAGRPMMNGVGASRSCSEPSMEVGRMGMIGNMYCNGRSCLTFSRIFYIFLCHFKIFKTWTWLLCQIHIFFYIKKH